MSQSALSPESPQSTKLPPGPKHRSFRQPMILLAATTLLSGAIAIAATPFNTTSHRSDSVQGSGGEATEVASQASSLGLIDDAKSSDQNHRSRNLRVLGLREPTEDGERVRIVAFEPDLDIYLHESTSDGIEVRTRRYLFGTSTDQTATAADVEELQEKYPEAFKLYKSYINEAERMPGPPYMCPAEEMSKLEGRGFLNSTLPISTMSLKDSQKAEGTTKNSNNSSKSPTGRTGVGKLGGKTGRSSEPSVSQKNVTKSVNDKKATSQKSGSTKSGSTKSGSTKKTTAKSETGTKQSGKSKSDSAQSRPQRDVKPKTAQASSKKTSGNRNQAAASKTTPKGSQEKTKATSKSTTSKPLPSERKSTPKKSVTKSPNPKISASKKMADKARPKSKTTKSNQAPSSSRADTSQDGANPALTEKDGHADDSTHLSADDESDSPSNRFKTNVASRPTAYAKTKPIEQGNFSDANPKSLATEPLTEGQAPTAESLENPMDVREMELDDQQPSTTDIPSPEEMQDEYWDAQLQPAAGKPHWLGQILATRMALADLNPS